MMTSLCRLSVSRLGLRCTTVPKVSSPRVYPPSDLRVNRAIFTSAIRLSSSFNVQDNEDFQERVKKCSGPVVIDFHATWCGPCKLLTPRLETAIAANKGKVVLAKVDIDELTDLALEYGVQAVPHVVGMKNGMVVDQFIGIQDQDQIDAFMKKLSG